MKTTVHLPEDRLVRRAVRALMDALGPADTVRFLALRRTRRLDVVARHRRWQRGLDPDAFLAEVFGREPP